MRKAKIGGPSPDLLKLGMPEPSEDEILEPLKQQKRETFNQALNNLVSDKYSAKAFLTEVSKLKKK